MKKLTSKQKQLVKEYAKNLQSRLNEDSKSAIGSLVIIDRNDYVLIEQKSDTGRDSIVIDSKTELQDLINLLDKLKTKHFMSFKRGK